MTLRQVSISFPKEMTNAQASARFDAFATATKSMGGCGGSENVAKQFDGEIVDSERSPLRELQIPPALQSILLGLQVGQSTPPFGTREEGARVLIVCGRDEPRAADLPTDEDLRDRLQQDRLNRRAQVYLRDLRRDAVIDYR
jgi:peptidyl-prolyl cis-trans isomerase SurA